MIITLNDLKSIALNNLSDINENVNIILYINNDSEVDEVRKSLFEIFGEEDDQQHVIRLVSQSQEVGYIKEKDVYSFVKARTKDSIGSGDYLEPPGKTGFKEKYKCPYAYEHCNQYYWTLRGSNDNYGSFEVPHCHIHDIDMIKER